MNRGTIPGSAGLDGRGDELYDAVGMIFQDMPSSPNRVQFRVVMRKSR